MSNPKQEKRNREKEKGAYCVAKAISRGKKKKTNNLKLAKVLNGKTNSDFSYWMTNKVTLEGDTLRSQKSS